MGRRNKSYRSARLVGRLAAVRKQGLALYVADPYREIRYHDDGPEGKRLRSLEAHVEREVAAINRLLARKKPTVWTFRNAKETAHGAD